MIERGEDIPPSAQVLVDRLVDAGAVHPLIDPTEHAIDPAHITAVIPVHLTDTSDGTALVALVGKLTGLAGVIVVDDASPLPLPALAAGDTRVTMIRRKINGGPAAARNTGLASVETTHVVFIDSDVDCRSDDILALAAWLVASGSAAIGPRICSNDDGTVLGAYESARSPLDMGKRPARVRAATRVGWLPAAVLLCEVAAIRSVTGFDESMRTGEDVDLVWRLDHAGFRCRYEPSIEVLHQRRSTLKALVHQRMGYGESTTALHRRHGDKVAPLRGSWSSVSSWGALALGLPIIAGCTAIATAVVLSRKLRFLPNNVAESSRLAWMTHLQVGRNLASAITRVWWPIAIAIAIFSRRARVALCAAAVVPALADWWETRPRLDPVRFTILRVIDDAAYGAGAWKKIIGERDAGAMLPVIARSSPAAD